MRKEVEIRPIGEISEEDRQIIEEGTRIIKRFLNTFVYGGPYKFDHAGQRQRVTKIIDPQGKMVDKKVDWILEIALIAHTKNERKRSNDSD